MQLTINHFLVLSALLLGLGLYGAVTRRNAIAMLMSVELILNAAAINFAAFSRFLPGQALHGELFAIFVVVIAAADTAIAMAIAVRLYRLRGSIELKDASELRH